MLSPFKLKGSLERVMLLTALMVAASWGCSPGGDGPSMDTLHGGDTSPSDSRQEETGIGDTREDVLEPKDQVDPDDTKPGDVNPDDTKPGDTETPDDVVDAHDVGDTETVEPVQPKVPPHSVVVPVGGGGTMKSTGFKARLSVGAPQPSGVGASSNNIIIIGTP